MRNHKLSHIILKYKRRFKILGLNPHPPVGVKVWSGDLSCEHSTEQNERSDRQQKESTCTTFFSANHDRSWIMLRYYFRSSCNPSIKLHRIILFSPLPHQRVSFATAPLLRARRAAPLRVARMYVLCEKINLNVYLQTTNRQQPSNGQNHGGRLFQNGGRGGDQTLKLPGQQHTNNTNRPSGKWVKLLAVRIPVTSKL